MTDQLVARLNTLRQEIIDPHVHIINEAADANLITQAIDELRRLAAEVERLSKPSTANSIAAMRHAADVFDRYARLHKAKDPSDFAKESANSHEASLLRQAIAEALSPPRAAVSVEETIKRIRAALYEANDCFDMSDALVRKIAEAALLSPTPEERAKRREGE